MRSLYSDQPSAMVLVSAKLGASGDFFDYGENNKDYTRYALQKRHKETIKKRGVGATD